MRVAGRLERSRMALQESNRARAPAAALRLKASLNTLVLQLTPLVAGLVADPWTAVATVIAMLRRKALAHESVSNAGERTFGTREVLKAGMALLGICIVIIVALTLANVTAKTWSDEIAWAAAVLMIISLLLGDVANGLEISWQTRASYWSFLAGALAVLLSLTAAIWQL
jgi:uncharacterized membrane protein